MAPLQSKKRKSTHSDAPNADSTSQPPNTENQTHTPTDSSPPRKKMKISQSQKQALIDNLQLELTDRARRLRATYSHQALSLRSRIESRVNRIPRSLRKVTMGELLDKYNETLKLRQPQEEERNAVVQPPANSAPTVAPKNHPLPAIPPETSSHPPSAAPSPAKTRGTKRSSDEISTSESIPEKEMTTNIHSKPQHQQPQSKLHVHIQEDDHGVEPPLSNPKKRTKANLDAPFAAATRGPAEAAARPKRTASRTANKTNATLNPPHSKVLSPRSPNSRTLPNPPSSPSHPISPSKPIMAHPASPLKSTSPLKSAVAASLAGVIEHTRTMKEKSRKISPREGNATETKKAGKAPPPSAKATTAAMGAGRTTRKGVAASTNTEQDRTVSQSSNTSSGTTVVTKGAAGTGAASSRKPAPGATKNNTTSRPATSRKATTATTTTTTAAAAKKTNTATATATAAKTKTAVNRKAVGAGTGTATRAAAVEPAARTRVLRKRA